MRISTPIKVMLACLVAVCCGCSDHIRPAASLPKTMPWDLTALSKSPSVIWIDKSSKVRSLIYEGLPYKGKPTSVFAYYATPGSMSGDLSKNKDLPAIVLVHGGEGHAYEEWVELWAKRGYAAISMDLSGRNSDTRTRLNNGGPDQSDEVKLGQMDSPIKDKWTYHAVANVILAHSLVRGFKEVDPDRTAIEGISWGGYVTLIVASLDNRFKAAVNEYGSGFLHENSLWKEWFDEKMTHEQRDRWVKLWDPSVYMESAVVPILFHSGTTAPYYPLDSFTKTYQLVKGPRHLSVIPAMPHESYFNKLWRPIPIEVRLFVDQHLKGGKPLAKITKVKIADGQVSADVVAETKLKEASLSYTTDTGPLINRQWRSVPAKIDGNSTASAKIPGDATIWAITVTDARLAVVSSEPVFVENRS